ncbi:hypothetical protein QYS36_21540, partial [Pseudomonas sp. G34]|nr:hypothetical protein [Pseudomonas sp. G34]
FTAFDQTRSNHQQNHSNHPVDAGAFYSNSPSVQPLFSSNSLIHKEFSDQAAPEVVRIIGRHSFWSTVYLRFIRISG